MHIPDILPALQRIALFALPLLLGVTCHEVAHGFAAKLQGDDTAWRAGRLTLNPIKHLDAMGTLMFIVTSYLGAFVIGWAKPVPVNFSRLRDPRWGLIFVSAAGPLTNFALALAFAGLYHGTLSLLIDARPDFFARNILAPLHYIGQAGVLVNVALGIFNLIPIPPLDGSKIVAGLLPRDMAISFMRVERFGFLIVILLLATGVLGRVLYPLLLFFVNLLL